MYVIHSFSELAVNLPCVGSITKNETGAQKNAMFLLEIVTPGMSSKVNQTTEKNIYPFPPPSS